MVEYRKSPSLVSALVILIAFVAVAYFVTASRPADDQGYMHWKGLVRYKSSAGETGHSLGDCVLVREQSKPMDANPKYRIERGSEDCDKVQD